MPKKFDIQLTGMVGDWDFSREKVQACLDSNPDAEISVLIDSTGGMLSTGLSISSLFKLHGNVNVHFAGLNASAATIASMGAKKITIDRHAMYLVHKVSLEFFEWASMNADQFREMIANVDKTVAELDKIDQNCAALYAQRCNRPVEEILGIMKEGKWLTAKEALDLGFVDEITDYAEDDAPEVTKAHANAMISNGIPVPVLYSSASAFERFMERVKEYFAMNQKNQNIMQKTFKQLCALLGVESFKVEDSGVTVAEADLERVENHIAALETAKAEAVAELEKCKADLAAKTEEVETLTARVAELEAKPGDDTATVINTAATPTAETPELKYCQQMAEAVKLFNSLP